MIFVILWPQCEQTPPRSDYLNPQIYLETSLNVQRFFLGFRFCLKASENNPTKHKTCSHILESLIIWQFLLREGMGESGGKAWKYRARWRNWGLEVLHPRETRSETGTLLWREQRRVTLSLLCGLQELFRKVRTWQPSSTKFWQSTMHRYREGALCTTKETTRQWVYLQLVLAWLIDALFLCEILCSI